ncbi:MAG: helix-turn-helix domain-containing protein [Halomonas sp.]|uniref:helix-turn-helix domain-containing protein n=1 Tax=unclassified Halomonas TaxID=2609666 RepID=UPI00264D5936|nr:helix-turn-helix domain-containing protein [Halomonas sp.]
MPSRSAVVFPKDLKVLKALGENILLAMKRRKITQTQLSERTGLSMPTLRNILRGEPSVSMGHYLVVLSSLGLASDLAKVALDDEFGRKLQDIELLRTTNRASIKSKNASTVVYRPSTEGRR